MASAPELQIIISSGPDDPRATLGFAAATAAGACGTQVVVFLVMNGAQWAFKPVGNEPQHPGFQPVSQMLELIQASGGRIEVCSSCLTEACPAAADGTRPSEMREGVHPGGLAAVVARMSKIPTVTF